METRAKRITWDDVDAAIERVEAGATTIEDANLLRAVLDRLRGDCDGSDCATESTAFFAKDKNEGDMRFYTDGEEVLRVGELRSNYETPRRSLHIVDTGKDEEE